MSFIDSLKLKPKSYEYFCARGNLFKNLGEGVEAALSFQKGYQLEGIKDVAFYMQGFVEYKLDHYEVALDIFDKLSKKYPKFQHLLNDKGNTLSALGRIEEAITNYTRAIEQDPLFYYAFNNRGDAFVVLGKMEAALSDFSRAIEINPKFDMAYYNRGNAYASLGKKEEAVIDYDKAIELNAKWDQAYNNRGITLFQMGRRIEAIQDFNKAIQLNPKLASAYQNRGNAFLELGRREEAIVEFTKTIQLNPNHEIAYNNRGIAFSNLNRKKEAIADHTKAIKLNPKYYEAYYNRGVDLSDLGRNDEAIVDFTKAIELNNKYDAGYYNRGNAYLVKNKKKEAIADYITAVELNPNDPLYLSQLGNVYFIENQQEKALEYLKRAQDIIEKLSEQDKLIKNLSVGNIQFIQEKISLIKQIHEQISKARLLVRQKTLSQEKNEAIENILDHFTKEAAPQILKVPKENNDNKILMDMILELTRRLEKIEQEKQMLQERVEIIENQDSIKIEQDLAKLNQNQLIYFKSFYWRLKNYLSACQMLQTGLFLNNNNAMIDSKHEKVIEILGKIFNAGSSIAGSVPLVGSVFEIISSAINIGFGYHKERKFNERVSRLAIVVQSKSIDLDIELKISGIQLAKDLKEAKYNQPQDQYSNYRDQISKAEQSCGFQEAKDQYWLIGIQNCLDVLIFLENNSEAILQEKQKKLREIVIDAIQQSECPKSHEVESSQRSSCCSIQ